MLPLRGAKGMLYEGGIRVPCIIRWPDKVAPHSTCETPIISTDFYPTLLEITGAPQPDGQVLDGVSLLPLMTDTCELDRTSIFWHLPAYLEAYKSTPGAFRTTPASVIRNGDWKLIEFFEENSIELYNLKEDIGETINLAKKFPEKAEELHRQLISWRKATGAPIPRELNPDFDPDERARIDRNKQ